MTHNGHSIQMIISISQLLWLMTQSGADVEDKINRRPVTEADMLLGKGSCLNCIPFYVNIN